MLFKINNNNNNNCYNNNNNKYYNRQKLIIKIKIYHRYKVSKHYYNNKDCSKKTNKF